MLLCVTNNSKVTGLHGHQYWQGYFCFVHVRPLFLNYVPVDILFLSQDILKHHFLKKKM
jgi:hypothetical protein